MNKSYFSICFVLNFFYQSLVVCNSKNFTSLVRFIPEYFIVFDAIVAEILSFFFRHSIDSWIYCYIYIFTCFSTWWFCILKPYWSFWLVLAVFCGVFGIFYMWDHIICKKKAILFFLPFLFGSLLFLFLSQFLWQRFPVLCWIGVWEWASLFYSWS